MASLPAVSVIVPCHNAAATIEGCVASAAAMEYDGVIEIVVFDDGSTDDSLAVLHKLSEAAAASYPPNRKLIVFGSADVGAGGAHGPAFARNRAVERSSGEYLCLLDADDECFPTRVKTQL